MHKLEILRKCHFYQKEKIAEKINESKFRLIFTEEAVVHIFSQFKLISPKS